MVNHGIIEIANSSRILQYKYQLEEKINEDILSYDKEMNEKISNSSSKIYTYTEYLKKIIRKEIEKISKELSRLKAILYEKNNEFKLSDGRTIQQAIVDNTNLRKLKTTYENLLLLKNTKKRVTEVNNSYFESKTLNFDQSKLKKRLEEIDSEIQKTDFEISKLNSIEFNI